MYFLAGLIGLISLLFLLIAVIGVVAPSLFKNKKTGEIPKRRELLLGGIVVSFVAFIISGWLLSTEEPQKQGQENNKVAQAVTELTEQKNAIEKKETSKPDKTLGVSPEEFRRSFNQIIAKVDTDYKMAELDIEQGEVNNIFKRKLSNSVGIIGAVNKSDGSLRDLMVIISGNESPTENLKAIVIILSATQALNNNIDIEKNSKVVIDMVKEAMVHVKTGKSVERKLGKLTYTASASELIGLMFAISQS